MISPATGHDFDIETGARRSIQEGRRDTMKLRTFAALGAAALMMATASTGYAVDASVSSQETVDIVVTSTGALSVSITESEAFDDISYSFQDQAVSGQLTVLVTDQRGSAAGWTFNLRGSDFTGGVTGANDSFPITGLALTHASTTRVAGNSDIRGITGYSLDSVQNTGQQIVSAAPGSGNGQYDVLYDGVLTIPGDTLVDEYTATITVEVPSAPN
jgi:hypothetical protein